MKLFLYLKRYPMIGGMILVLVTLMAYSPLLWNQHQFLMDDHVLLGRLHAIHSWWELWTKDIIDLQPVRDATFYLDYQLSTYLFRDTYHLTNLVIFLIALVILYSLLGLVLENYWASFSIVMMMGLHPANVIPVSWISARKHLLSYLFILVTWYLYELISRGRATKIYFYGILSVAYTLSLWSQPINALFPLWIAMNEFKSSSQQKKKLLLVSAIMLFIGLLTIIANIVYYHKIQVAGDEQLLKPSYNYYTIRSIPLMFGRYFFNVIYPFDQALYYRIVSFENLFGTILCLFSFYSIYRFLPQCRRWLLLYLFSLIPVTVYLLASFVSNTYALMSNTLLLLMFFMAGSALCRNKNFSHSVLFKPPQWAYMGVGLFLLILLGKQTFQDTLAWENSIDVYRQSFEREAEVNTGVAYLTNQLARELVLKHRIVPQEKMEHFVLTFLELKKAIRQTYDYKSNSIFIVWFNFAHYLMQIENLPPKAKLKIYKLVEDPMVLYSNYGMLLIQSMVGDHLQVEHYLHILIHQLHYVRIPVFPIARKESYLIIFNEIFNTLENTLEFKPKLKEMKSQLTQLEEKIFRPGERRRSIKFQQSSPNPLQWLNQEAKSRE